MNIISGLLGLLVKFVFNLILKLFDIIFAPIIAIFIGLFPDLRHFGCTSSAICNYLYCTGCQVYAKRCL